MHPELDSPEVSKNETEGRYELAVEKQIAFLEYTQRGKVIALVHTEVPESLEGKGIGNKLVRGALDLARAEGTKVIPACTFVAAFISRHPEYGDLVQPE
jgi:predicted GNAT family acetyltransferase